MNTNHFGHPRFTGILGSALLVGAVGLLDYVTGPWVSFSLFYLIPVGVATWWAGVRAGTLLSFASAVLWYLIDISYPHYPSAWIPLWNTLVRLAFFLLFSFFLSELQARRRLTLERALTEHSSAEQRRVGRELHDSVLQDVLALKIFLTQLQRRLAARGAAEADEVGELGNQLNEVTSGLRRLIDGFAAVDIEAEEFFPALERAAANLSRLYDLPIQVRSSAPVTLRDATTARHLVMVAQEAMLNALKHAQASRLTVEVEVRGDDLILVVSDDGVGLPKHYESVGGVGIRTMHQRAELRGATLKFEQQTPRGTTVTLSVPNTLPVRQGARARGGFRVWG